MYYVHVILYVTKKTQFLLSGANKVTKFSSQSAC